MEELKHIIGKNIIALRKRRGMTQAELAAKMNYSDKAVSKWECGDAVPDVGVLKQLAELFGVTVDYLLEAEHGNAQPENTFAEEKQKKIIITLLSCSLVWLVATLLFTIINICAPGTEHTGFIFIYAVPVTATVLLVFNSIWGKRRWNYFIISMLVWSLLASLYFAFIEYNVWLIFILGIPAQLIIVLWSGLGHTKKQEER